MAHSHKRTIQDGADTISDYPRSDTTRADSGDSESKGKFVVDDHSSWIELHTRLNGFRDGAVKEVFFFSGSCVHPGGVMHFGPDRNARLEILVQFLDEETPAAWLVFTGVTRFDQDSEFDLNPPKATARCGDSFIEFAILTMHIRAHSLEVVLLGDEYLDDDSTLLSLW